MMLHQGQVVLSSGLSITDSHCRSATDASMDTGNWTLDSELTSESNVTGQPIMRKLKAQQLANFFFFD